VIVTVLLPDAILELPRNVTFTLCVPFFNFGKFTVTFPERESFADFTKVFFPEVTLTFPLTVTPLT
jgi:hypothetical protein